MACRKIRGGVKPMNLLISDINKKKEDQSLTEIFNAIEENQSILFNSGAGAGKTYALIESLRFVINRQGEKLKKHNQKIMCITYTNVATKEVRERLGNSDVVLVSTIHERIWDLIKDHQEALVDIHKGKLDVEIDSIKNKMDTEKGYEKYRNLQDVEKEAFSNIMLESKELFYENYNENAKKVKDIFESKLIDIPNILNNVSEFKKITGAIYNLEKYEDCLGNIKLSKPKYKKVEYNPFYNSDQLHKMRISHDTLLEYGLKIIEKYDVLKQIVIDKYPYVFIDEYQDTNEKIVKIMSLLEIHAKKIKHNIFIAYFGDTAQNIYDNGIGERIKEIHPKLKPIKKDFNRRSADEVIEIINRIRNDDIKQKSIYDNFVGGSVEFYIGDQNDVQLFIDKYTSEWNINKKNPLHCFLLTNKTVAEYSGFINIYNFFKETKKYSGNNYNQLNTELMSNDPAKLGDVPRLLYNIAAVNHFLKDESTPIIELIKDKELYQDMSFQDLWNFIELLKKQEGATLEHFINSMIKLNSINADERYKKFLQRLFGFEGLTSDKFKNLLIEKLFDETTQDEELEKVNKSIQELLGISMNEYDSWYKHISNIQTDKIIYHTYHGTKGLQFDNVIIVMQNSFGKIGNYFSFFFENYLESNVLDGKEKKKFEQVRNLIYVSCSRAVKNLRILYLDDVTDFEDRICGIFGNIHKIGHMDTDNI